MPKAKKSVSKKAGDHEALLESILSMASDLTLIFRDLKAVRAEIDTLKAALKTGKQKPEFVRGLPEVVLSYLPTDRSSDLDKCFAGLCDDEERDDLRKALERFCSAWENFREDDGVTVFSMALRATEVAFIARNAARDAWTLEEVIGEFLTLGHSHIITQKVGEDRVTHYLTIYNAETEKAYAMDYEPGD